MQIRIGKVRSHPSMPVPAKVEQPCDDQDKLEDAWMSGSVYLPRLMAQRNPTTSHPVRKWVHQTSFALSRRAGRAFTFLAVRNMSPTTPIPPPRQEDIKLVPYGEVDARIPLKNVLVADHIPVQEKCTLEPMVFGMQRCLSKLAPVNPQDIPEINADLDTNIKRTLPDYFFSLPWVARPETPDAIAQRPNDVLGAVSLAGPFAAYIERVPGSDRYIMDLSNMCQYETREGLAPLGFIAELLYDPSTHQMVTTRIDLPAENKRVHANDEPIEWRRAQRIALASLSTHMTAVRHLLWSHLAAGEAMAAITARHLNANHPIHTILHPHTFRTTATNRYRVPSLISDETSALPSVFSYDKRRVLELIDDSASRFDLAHLNPVLDASRRNMTGNKDYPYLQNVGAIWEIMQKHVRDYVNTFYKSDDDIRNCVELQNWYEALSGVKGAQKYAGALGIEALVRLVTVVMYTASVEHENVGNLVSNYTTLPQIPFTVRLDGSLPSEAEYQAYMNLLMLTSTPFDPLLGNQYPGMDAKGCAIMTKMCDALRGLDDELRKNHPVPHHTVLPSKCAVSAAT